VSRDEYLSRVGYRLRDLPWGTRRDLLAEIRSHLDELPADTDLEARLGTPEDYAADLRSAAGLERRRGPIAFLRARRPRNLILLVLTLTAIGLAIGAVAWIDSYQPIATGNTSYGPLGSHRSPAGDGEYVVFHEGKRFRYGMTIWNTGRHTVRVVGVPELFGLPISYRLLMSAPTTFDRGGIPTPFTRFRPFDLKPGEQRGLIFAGVYHQPCRTRAAGLSIGWESVPVRFKFLWRTATVPVQLPENLAFVFRKSSLCPSATP
jgi:hypothetical protein